MSQDTAYGADEPQPSSALNEQRAQSKREDGTNRGGADTANDTPAQTGAPETGLSPDEQQPLAADAERAALTEREDGTNRG